jgi:nitrite reductase (NADH) small subunit
MTALSTMTERCIGSLSQIPRGEGRQFDVGGRLVAVFHLRKGGVHVTQAACPHRGGPLADGIIGGTAVICPLHQKKFDVTTGHELTGHTGATECSLATFPARVTEQGQIMVSF